MEAQDLLCAVLETMVAGKEKFKAEVIIDILNGKETAEIKSYHLEELEMFGSVTGEEGALLGAVIRQAMINGYIAKEIENYGVLKITKAGQAYLKIRPHFLSPKIMNSTMKWKKLHNVAVVLGQWIQLYSPCSRIYVKDVETHGVTSICYIPRSFVRSHGYDLPYYH